MRAFSFSEVFSNGMHKRTITTIFFEHLIHFGARWKADVNHRFSLEFKAFMNFHLPKICKFTTEMTERRSKTWSENKFYGHRWTLTAINFQFKIVRWVLLLHEFYCSRWLIELDLQLNKSSQLFGTNSQLVNCVKLLANRSLGSCECSGGIGHSSTRLALTPPAVFMSHLVWLIIWFFCELWPFAFFFGYKQSALTCQLECNRTVLIKNLMVPFDSNRDAARSFLRVICAVGPVTHRSDDSIRWRVEYVTVIPLVIPSHPFALFLTLSHSLSFESSPKQPQNVSEKCQI